MELSSLFAKLSEQFQTEFELVAGEIQHRGLRDPLIFPEGL